MHAWIQLQRKTSHIWLVQYLLNKLGSHAFTSGLTCAKSNGPAIISSRLHLRDKMQLGMNQCKGNCLWLNYGANDCSDRHINDSKGNVKVLI